MSAIVKAKPSSLTETKASRESEESYLLGQGIHFLKQYLTYITPNGTSPELLSAIQKLLDGKSSSEISELVKKYRELKKCDKSSVLTLDPTITAILILRHLLLNSTPTIEILYNLGFLYSRKKQYHLAAHFLHYADKLSGKPQNAARVALDKLISENKITDPKWVKEEMHQVYKESEKPIDDTLHNLSRHEEWMKGFMHTMRLSMADWAEGIAQNSGGTHTFDREAYLKAAQIGAESLNVVTAQLKAPHIERLKQVKKTIKQHLLDGETSELEALIREKTVQSQRPDDVISLALFSETILDEFYSVSQKIIKETNENDVILFLGRSPLLIAETCKASAHFNRKFALIPFTGGTRLFGHWNSDPKKSEFESLKDFLSHTLQGLNINEKSFNGSIILVDRIESGKSTLAFVSLLSQFFPELAPKLKIIGLVHDNEEQHQCLQFEFLTLPLRAEAIQAMTVKKSTHNFLALGTDFPHESWPKWQTVNFKPALDACVIARCKQIEAFVAKKEGRVLTSTATCGDSKENEAEKGVAIKAKLKA